MPLDAETLAPALVDVRALVQADGGDLVLERVEDTTAHLRLIVEGAECAECVMPRQFLEQVALDMMQSSVAALSAVRIDDPRET